MDLHYRRPSSSSSYRSSSASSSPKFAPSPDYLQAPSPPSNNDPYRRYSTDAQLYYSPYPQSSSQPPSDSTSSPLTGPLSLQERRRRNKAASAKYRAKKNQQHGEMRRLIASLTRENELLKRQLEHMSRENSRLKATCDNLRGKMLAAKMIHKLLGDNNSNSNSNSTQDAEQSTTCSEQRLGMLMKRFEEDMDFDDDIDEIEDIETDEQKTTPSSGAGP